MRIYRVYTGEDGHSHLESLEGTAHPLLTDAQSATKFFFKRFPAGAELPPHPAPRRMVTVIVAGTLELEFANGTVHRFVPGDVRLMEDTSGAGHTTRVVGDEEVVIAVVPLDDSG